MTTKTDNGAVREALGLFRSMVLSGEGMTPEAQAVWDRAYAVANPNPETIEEQAAHGVVLADVLEPLVRQWLDEKGLRDDEGLIVPHEEIPDLVAFLAGELVAKGFGKR